MKTLITSKEVILYGPEDYQFPEAAIEPQILPQEMDFAVNWLGYEFYQDLISDAYDLSVVDEWVEGETYEKDAVVQCKTVLYKSLQPINKRPLDNAVGWVKISKLKTEANANLYDNFLSKYLAFVIEAAALEFARPVTGKGLTVEGTDSQSSATLADKSYRKDAGLSGASKILDAMGYWMLREKHQNESTAYDKALIISQCKRVVKPNQKRRRIHTRTMPVIGGDIGREYRVRLGSHTYELIL